MATFGICALGAGFGVQLVRARFPDPPTQIDMDTSFKIIANFYITISKPSEFFIDLRVQNYAMTPVIEAVLSPLYGTPAYDAMSLSMLPFAKGMDAR